MSVPTDDTLSEPLSSVKGTWQQKQERAVWMVKLRQGYISCLITSFSGVLLILDKCAVGTCDFTSTFMLTVYAFTTSIKKFCELYFARGKNCRPLLLPACLPACPPSLLPSNQLSKSTHGMQPKVHTQRRGRGEEFKNDVWKMNMRIAALRGKRDFNLIAKSGSGT